MKTFDSNFWVIFIIFLFGVIVILFFPYWFTTYSFQGIDFRDTGEIGDTIGGILGPFIAIAAAILTFLAFWVQFKANIEQRRDIQLERFETKFYELLRLHRANVEEIEIKDKWRARKAFVKMFHELRFAFYLVKSVISEFTKKSNELGLGFDPKDELSGFKIAYHVFFYGYGDSSNRLLIEPLSALASKKFLDALLLKIHSIQKEYKKDKNPNNWCKLEISIGNGSKYEHEAFYKPFDGHLSRLGHYYRHLFQTVKYVAEFSKIDLKPSDKYDYLKNLRAQLSTHEQLLLYYNSLTSLGSPWLEGDQPYLTTYKLIKNIPIPLADFGLDPRIKFKKEVEETMNENSRFFEWHEIVPSN